MSSIRQFPAGIVTSGFRDMWSQLSKSFDAKLNKYPRTKPITSAQRHQEQTICISYRTSNNTWPASTILLMSSLRPPFQQHQRIPYLFPCVCTKNLTSQSSNWRLAHPDSETSGKSSLHFASSTFLRNIFSLAGKISEVLKLRTGESGTEFF